MRMIDLMEDCYVPSDSTAFRSLNSVLLEYLVSGYASVAAIDYHCNPNTPNHAPPPRRWYSSRGLLTEIAMGEV